MFILRCNCKIGVRTITLNDDFFRLKHYFTHIEVDTVVLFNIVCVCIYKCRCIRSGYGEYFATNVYRHYDERTVKIVQLQ